MTWRRKNKFGATKTTFNGRKFDSKYEAETAMALELRKKAGDIKDYECQYRVDVDVYNKHGRAIGKLQVRHKVDFRIHENDGTYTLLEAKGFETADYRKRRNYLLYLWLPEHPDHRYEVHYSDGRIKRYENTRKVG